MIYIHVQARAASNNYALQTLTLYARLNRYRIIDHNQMKRLNVAEMKPVTQ